MQKYRKTKTIIKNIDDKAIIEETKELLDNIKRTNQSRIISESDTLLLSEFQNFNYTPNNNS